MNILEDGAALFSAALIAVTVSLFGTSAKATSHSTALPEKMLSTGLILPPMDAANGRLLFVSRECVICHSVNGVGGRDAPMLDARFMDQPMNPFEFAANMWRGADKMVAMQRKDLG